MNYYRTCVLVLCTVISGIFFTSAQASGIPTGDLKINGKDTDVTCVLVSYDCNVELIYSIQNTKEATVFIGRGTEKERVGTSGWVAWVGSPRQTVRLSGVTTSQNVLYLHAGTTTAGQLLDTVVVTGVCPPEYTAHLGQCVLRPPTQKVSGDIKANGQDTGATCTILSGRSNCSGTLSWTSEGASSASVWVGATNVAKSTSGSVNISWLTHGPNHFKFVPGTNQPTRTSDTILDSVVITGVCETGTSWNNGVCWPGTAPVLKFGSIQFKDSSGRGTLGCSLSLGANACSTTVTYVAYNVESASLWDGTRLLATGLENTGFVLSGVSPNMGALELREGTTRNGKLLASERPLADCKDSSWSYTTNKCESSSYTPSVTTSTTVTECPLKTVRSGSSCVPVSGDIKLTVSDCFIGHRSSSCDTRVSWTSSGLSSLSVLQDKMGIGFYPTPLSHAGLYYSIYHEKDPFYTDTVNTFSAVSGGVVYDKKIPKATCASGTEWNGHACLNVGAFARINASNCEIPAGSAACQTTVSWAAEGVTEEGVRAYIRHNGTLLSTQTSNTGLSRMMPHGTNNFRISTYEGQRLASIDVIASCAAGSKWNQVICEKEGAGVASGSIVANNMETGATCTIPSGSSNCSASISWNTQNVSSASVWVGTFSPATGTSGSFTPTWLGYGENKFELKNGSLQSGTLLDSVTITGVCASGTSWSNGACRSTGTTTILPSGDIQAPATCIISLDRDFCSVTVSWTSMNTDSVSVWTGSHQTGYNSPATGKSGSFTASILRYGENNFELRNGSSRSGTLLDSMTVFGVCTNGTSWSNGACRVTTATIASSPLGSITANGLETGATCTIPAGASNCSGTIEYTTQNTSLASVWIGSSNPASGKSGSFTIPWLGYGDNKFELRNGSSQSGTLLDTVTITGVCASGTSWSNGMCQSKTPPYGTLTARSYSNTGDPAGTCTISEGKSTCSATADWYAGNVSSASLWLGASNLATGISGQFTSHQMGYGSNRFELYNGLSKTGTRLATVTITGVCVTGTSWSNGACRSTATTVIPPTGDIQAPTTCTIPANESNCSGAVTWTTANADNASVWIGSSNPASGKSGSFTIPWLGYGDNKFELRNGSSQSGTLLDTVTITGVCAMGSSWSNGACRTPVMVSETPKPDLVAGLITPTTATFGSVTEFAVTVNNTGSANTGNGFNVMIQKATSDSGAGTTDVRYAYTSSLAAGSSRTVKNPVAPNTTGIIYLRACADKKNISDAGAISEKDETNNCGSWTAVTVLAPQSSTETTQTTQSTQATQTTTSNATAPSSSGTISASPNPCTIPSGSDRCSVTITWNTTNVQSGGKTGVWLLAPPAVPTEMLFSSNLSGSHAMPSVNTTGGTFYLRDSSGNELASVFVQGVCASGTTWNGTICKSNSASIGSGNAGSVLGLSALQCVSIPYNLHRGHESKNVKALQTFLHNEGLLSEVTGFYGDKTVAAVKAYQESKGLPMTGMVYGFTRAAIAEDSCQ